MTAAGIEHCHVDNAHLPAAIRKSSVPGVWVVDEKGAKEGDDFSHSYDYSLR
jgi:hypothetical protein